MAHFCINDVFVWALFIMCEFHVTGFGSSCLGWLQMVLSWCSWFPGKYIYSGLIGFICFAASIDIICIVCHIANLHYLICQIFYLIIHLYILTQTSQFSIGLIH